MKQEHWSFGPVVVRGQLGSKSNSRRLVHFGGRPRVIKSKDALDYVYQFRQQVRSLIRDAPFEGTVRLTAHCFYKDKRRDLDIALLQDCLQPTKKGNWPGIILNDRQVQEIHAYRHVDKKNPRVIFELVSLHPIEV